MFFLIKINHKALWTSNSSAHNAIPIYMIFDMPLIQTFRHNIANSKRKIFTTFFTRSFAAGVPPTTDSE